MKLLVTGFLPFHDEKINPSQMILPTLSVFPSLQTLVLPVSYSRAWPILYAELQKQSYDFVLMLGLAGGRSLISLERVALNFIDSNRADEDGEYRTEIAIDSTAAPALFTKLDLRQLVHSLGSQDSSFEISTSAGSFVCNLLYFQFLRWQVMQGNLTEGIFVHLPFLPEQIVGKEAVTPSLSFSKMSESIHQLLIQIQLMQGRRSDKKKLRDLNVKF